MRSVEALKEKARHHEQNEEWKPARDLYMQAIAALDGEAQLDIGLYNRVGDILVKIGDFEKAVEHYEQATDLYLEAELPNNAIAVCKKVARHLPGRNEVYLRMGQIRASQGFLVDARENFLIYAAKVEQAGDTDEAIRALVEFAALAPEDTEIRLAVAAQLEKHGREAEALEQLVAGYRVLVRREDAEQAEMYAARIRELDPEADPEALAASADPGTFEATSLGEDHGGVESFEASFGDIDLSPEPAAEEGAEETSPSDDGTEADLLSDPAAGSDPGGITVVEADFGEIVLAGGDEAADPVEAPAPDRDPDGGEEEDPIFDIGGELPLMAFGDDDEDQEDVPLPFLDFEEEEEIVVAEAQGESTVDEGVTDPAARDDAGAPGTDGDEGESDHSWSFEPDSDQAVPDEEGPAGAGTDEAAASVGTFEAASADSGSPGGAGTQDWAALRAAYDPARPDTAEAESLVEAAFQNGGAEVLTEAYELLARALEAEGDPDRAREVWRQVRELDPEHEDAGRALGVQGGAEGDPDAGSSEEAVSYVDLGSMIFGEEEKPEKTTRFQVEYQEPSGDEAADFAKMLTQFKAKVAENFDDSDVRARHDLGTAYKEMGLLDEAVSEFQQALRASADHLPTYELLGQTFMERGEHAAAVRVLERALKIPSEVEDELIGIYYYLGRAHEELGQVGEAVGFYDRVFALDINFADVTSRLRELR